MLGLVEYGAVPNGTGCKQAPLSTGSSLLLMLRAGAGSIASQQLGAK